MGDPIVEHLSELITRFSENRPVLTEKLKTCLLRAFNIAYSMESSKLP